MDIIASITLSDSLTAVLEDITVLEGELSPEGTITAEIANQGLLEGILAVQEEISAEMNLPETIHDRPYTGEYVVTPKARKQTVLETQGRVLSHNVTVLEVPYYVISNESGDTVYIANEV